jgi:pimeloyl-ACP methyl ester carboxylesterase
VPDLADAYWQPLGTEHWMLVQHDRPVIVCPGAAPRTWAGFEQWLTALDVEDRLGEIHLPTLIVAGEQDPFMPLAQVARLPAGIPDAEFLVLAESGHDVEQESVDGPKYAAAVRRFLATLASPDG